MTTTAIGKATRCWSPPTPSSPCRWRWESKGAGDEGSPELKPPPAIANGSASLDDAPSLAMGQTHRCIERMRQLGVRQVRIMSWPVRSPEEVDLKGPRALERLDRLRRIVDAFREAGLEPLHENCMNWGSLSAAHMELMMTEIPALDWIFDTGNPVHTHDHAFPESRPRQSPWDVWCVLRDRVRAISLGTGHDRRPPDRTVTFFNEIAPYARWVLFTHDRGDPPCEMAR